jgi:hypothetical protein
MSTEMKGFCGSLVVASGGIELVGCGLTVVSSRMLVTTEGMAGQKWGL